MKRKKWDAKIKVEIVLTGLKGKLTVAQICNSYGISQRQFYLWRDEFFSQWPSLFEKGGREAENGRLKQKTIRLQAIIGELTEELKKNDYDD